MWVCYSCDGTEGSDEEPFENVLSLRAWFVCERLDAKILRVLEDYDFGFYLKLLTLSGEEVRDEQGRLVGCLYTRWTRFEDVWFNVYHSTGGRIRQMVFASLVVDEIGARSLRWSSFLSRSDARRCTLESPYAVSVLLRGWW